MGPKVWSSDKLRGQDQARAITFGREVALAAMREQYRNGERASHLDMHYAVQRAVQESPEYLKVPAEKRDPWRQHATAAAYNYLCDYLDGDLLTVTAVEG